MTSTDGSKRPDHLVVEPVDERHLGILRSGKEAQIDLVEYVDEVGATALVARKRYLPRTVTTKGQLEDMGVQRASTFRHDVQYREGRQFRKSRDRRAVEQMSAHGRALLQDRWMSHEHDVMRALWDAGCAVPYPISYADDRLDMEYLGTVDGAAPQLSQARLRGAALHAAWEQLLAGLAAITAAGWAHGDLSAYNLFVVGGPTVVHRLPSGGRHRGQSQWTPVVAPRRHEHRRLVRSARDR